MSETIDMAVLADALGRELIERGLVIRAGFEGYQLLFNVTPESDVERRAFFAGAQHLFAAIMNSGLDEGVDATNADLRRMSNIAAELKVFEGEMDAAMRKRGH